MCENVRSEEQPVYRAVGPISGLCGFRLSGLEGTDTMPAPPPPYGWAVRAAPTVRR